MIASTQDESISLVASDASRQKRVHVDDVPVDASVGELVQGLVDDGMNLPRKDPEGRPMSYHVRLEREGRHLHASERVGDVLKDRDEIVLHPRITAGGD